MSEATTLKWQNKNSSTLFCNYSSSDWLTDNQTWEVSAPQSDNKKKKPFNRKQHSRWLYESRLAVSFLFPPSRPFISTIAIQVPNCTHAACCWSVHMTNYFWAYYQKSVLARGSGWGEGERKRGALGIQTKPAKPLQTKERDKFPLLLTSKKNSF